MNGGTALDTLDMEQETVFELLLLLLLLLSLLLLLPLGRDRRLTIGLPANVNTSVCRSGSSGIGCCTFCGWNSNSSGGFALLLQSRIGRGG